MPRVRPAFSLAPHRMLWLGCRSPASPTSSAHGARKARDALGQGTGQRACRQGRPARSPPSVPAPGTECPDVTGHPRHTGNTTYARCLPRWARANAVLGPLSVRGGRPRSRPPPYPGSCPSRPRQLVVEFAVYGPGKPFEAAVPVNPPMPGSRSPARALAPGSKSSGQRKGRQTARFRVHTGASGRLFGAGQMFVTWGTRQFPTTSIAARLKLIPGHSPVVIVSC